jgi:hypothetical protein
MVAVRKLKFVRDFGVGRLLVESSLHTFQQASQIKLPLSELMRFDGIDDVCDLFIDAFGDNCLMP